MIHGNFLVAPLLAATFVAGTLTASTPARAVDSPRPMQALAGWAPYWDTQFPVLPRHTQKRFTVMPFWFAVNRTQGGGTRVVAKTSSPIPDYPRRVTVMPSVTDGTGRGHLSRVLRDESRRAEHVKQLVGLADGYDGVDLDYETFAFVDGQDSWRETREGWRDFLRELSAALHSQGKKLSVTVPPSFPGGRGYWVYDYETLAVEADVVRIMAYDYSVGSPGPIAPKPWVGDIVAYAKTVIPARKLSVGVPSYGRAWPVNVAPRCSRRGEEPSSFSFTSARISDTFAGYDHAYDTSKVTANEETGESEYRFRQKLGGKCSVVWEARFFSEQDVAERTRWLTTAHKVGVALWTIPGVGGYAWEEMSARSGGGDGKVGGGRRVKPTVRYRVHYPQGTSDMTFVAKFVKGSLRSTARVQATP